MKINRLITLIVLSALITSGCSAGKEFTYEPAQESPPGPGLFSGKDGVFIIYDEESSKNPNKQPENYQKDKSERSQ